jgi:serine protease AprX
MPTTLLLTFESDDEDAVVRETGVEVLARYPDGMLVRATDEQTRDIRRLGLHAVPLSDRPVVTLGRVR